jgi:hypothetical protein
VLAVAPTEDAFGEVRAANQATEALLLALAAFRADAARQWQPSEARPAKGVIGP